MERSLDAAWKWLAHAKATNQFSNDDASPYLSSRYPVPRHRRTQLRPVFLGEPDRISSLFIYPTDAIPTLLLNNKKQHPCKTIFNAYMIKHNRNTVLLPWLIMRIYCFLFFKMQCFCYLSLISESLWIREEGRFFSSSVSYSLSLLFSEYLRKTAT